MGKTPIVAPKPAQAASTGTGAGLGADGIWDRAFPPGSIPPTETPAPTAAQAGATAPVRVVRMHPEASLPSRGSPGAVGLDLCAFLLSETGRENTSIVPPSTTKVIPTGLRIAPPPGYYLQVCSRSGLAAKALFVANAPGIVDPDYTGEIKVLLFNGGHTTYYVRHGDRVAQLVVAPCIVMSLLEVSDLPLTERGDGGFGSTGR